MFGFVRRREFEELQAKHRKLSTAFHEFVIAAQTNAQLKRLRETAESIVSRPIGGKIAEFKAAVFGGSRTPIIGGHVEWDDGQEPSDRIEAIARDEDGDWLVGTIDPDGHCNWLWLTTTDKHWRIVE